jgi:hypothetical protein
MLVAFFGEMFQKNVLYDELYQILAGLPAVRCLRFAARGKNWEDRDFSGDYAPAIPD